MHASLKDFLVNLIKLTGHISVSQLIEESLFHPTLGYYNTKQPFGREGDFVTSPEISQVFGELIAIYFIHINQHHYQNKKPSFIEMGAGQGILMKDILRTFKKFNFHPTINIVEKSPKLTKIQQAKLPGYKISWHDKFSDFTKKNHNPIFFIANELFDCFPINQLIHKEDSLKEIVVSLDASEDLQFSISANTLPINNKDQKLPEDIILEISPMAQNLMTEISKEIHQNGGLGIIIDYGYNKNPLTSTLQAIKNHKKCDILKNIGQCDVSSLVNFALLKKIAEDHGLQTSLISQKEFLLSLGIEKRENQTKENNILIKSEIRRLIDQNQMGNLFKVLIFWK
jgi:NADH dehydrogenase [ubiquinone] 1 alpha subcomplex assembly factor 7